jgi:CrcB protein
MNWLLVFIGGGMGSMLRYFIAQQLVQSKHFPWATLVSNVLATALLALLVV